MGAEWAGREQEDRARPTEGREETPAIKIKKNCVDCRDGEMERKMAKQGWRKGASR